MWPPVLVSLVNASAIPFRELTASLILSLFLISVSDCQSTGLAISFDGTPIEYEVRGAGSTALVFVHGGLGCSKWVWDEQMSFFDDKYTVVSLSFAGHGQSGHDRTEYSMESFGKDVAAVLKHLDLNQVILVGHSMGRIVSVEAAVDASDKVIGIIGIDCLNKFELKWDSAFVVEFFINPLREDFKGTIENFVRAMFTDRANPNLVALTVTRLAVTSPKPTISELKYWFEYQNKKFLNRVSLLNIPITTSFANSPILRKGSRWCYRMLNLVLSQVLYPIFL